MNLLYIKLFDSPSHALISGGHPHNWTRISSECLALIASLTDRLIVHQEWAANGINREKRMQIEEEKKNKNKKQIGIDKQRGRNDVMNIVVMCLFCGMPALVINDIAYVRYS